MKKDNKKCIVCGKVYTFCTGCREFDKYPRWMAIFHNENCKELYDIANDYLAKSVPVEELKERLENCDLSYRENLHHIIKNVVDEVVPVKTVSRGKRREASIVEEAMVVTSETADEI